MAPPRLGQIAVCIIRIEAQSETLLIAVTTQPDIGRNLHLAFEERPHYFTDTDEALAAIGLLLTSFKDSARRRKIRQELNED